MSLAIEESDDLLRVKNLPRRVYDREQAERDARDLTPLLTTPAGKKAGVSLFPQQAFVLREFFEHRGAFAALDTGDGKTLVSFLAPYVADAKRPVLVIPEGLREKTHKEFAEYARHWVTPRPAPRIVGYKELTYEQNVDLLERLEPDLYVFDEFHKASKQEGSAAKRLGRDIDARNVPALVMTATSGRLSILDYSHGLTWALKEGAPVPLDHDEVEAWANALDLKDPRMSRRLKPGALLDLIELYDVEGVDDLGRARAAYCKRLVETYGYVFPNTEGCDQPLTIRQVVAPEDKQIDQHFKRFREEAVTPDDWDITDPLSAWNLEAQLGAGFSYVPDPRPPEEWLERRKAFAKFVRRIIAHSANTRRPLDTEKAVKKAYPTHEAIVAWQEIEKSFKLRTKPVWYSGSVVYAAADWAAKNHGLIWVQHLAVGEALAEVTGLPFYSAQGETAYGASIERDPGKGTVILSIGSNIEGRNLQDRWHKNLIIGFPQSALYVHQLLSRTHRYGQRRPVEATVMLTSGGTAYSFDMAQREAEFVFSTQGQRQKLLRAHIERTTFRGKALRWTQKSA
jgi:hypothetical protein